MFGGLFATREDKLRRDQEKSARRAERARNELEMKERALAMKRDKERQRAELRTKVVERDSYKGIARLREKVRTLEMEQDILAAKLRALQPSAPGIISGGFSEPTRAVDSDLAFSRSRGPVQLPPPSSTTLPPGYVPPGEHGSSYPTVFKMRDENFSSDQMRVVQPGTETIPSIVVVGPPLVVPSVPVTSAPGQVTTLSTSQPGASSGIGDQETQSIASSIPSTQTAGSFPASQTSEGIRTASATAPSMASSVGPVAFGGASMARGSAPAVRADDSFKPMQPPSPLIRDDVRRQQMIPLETAPMKLAQEPALMVPPAGTHREFLETGAPISTSDVGRISKKEKKKEKKEQKRHDKLVRKEHRRKHRTNVLDMCGKQEVSPVVTKHTVAPAGSVMSSTTTGTSTSS